MCEAITILAILYLRKPTKLRWVFSFSGIITAEVHFLMEQLMQTLFDYLAKLGSVGLLAAIFIDALGLPFPGGLMIVMFGFLINRGDVNLFEVMLAIYCGYLTGTTAAYYIGKNIGEPFIKKYGRILRVTPERFAKARQWLNNFSAAYIIFGRFIPTLGNVTPYIAGISQVKLPYFLIYSSIFTLLWSAVNIAVGYLFGQNWRQVAEAVSTKSWIIGLLFIMAYLAYKYYKSTKVTQKGED